MLGFSLILYACSYVFVKLVHDYNGDDGRERSIASSTKLKSEIERSLPNGLGDYEKYVLI